MDQSEADLIARVRELARTKFTERAAVTDRENTFAHENVADLVALRVPSMPIAKAEGGLGVSAHTQVRVVEEVAYGCGSTAVALNMHLLGAGGLAALPPFPARNAVVEDIGKNSAMVCGPISIPAGEIDNRGTGIRFSEDGDYLVANGRSGFASMSEGATYVLATGLIDRGEGSEPDMVFAFPKLSTPGIRNMMNWDALGLRSTASHDIGFEDARIPRSEAMALPLANFRVIVEAAGSNPALAAARAHGILGIPAIWLGLAQAAFDFTVDYVQKRHGMFAGENSALGPAVYRSAEPWAQMGIGEMDAWLGSGRVVLYDMVRRLAEPFPDVLTLNHELVRTIYHLRRMSEEVSAGAMRVCGAHAYVRSRSLERIYRDMVGGNVMAWKTDLLRQMLGMAALGMPITVGGPSPV